MFKCKKYIYALTEWHRWKVSSDMWKAYRWWKWMTNLIDMQSNRAHTITQGPRFSVVLSKLLYLWHYHSLWSIKKNLGGKYILEKSRPRLVELRLTPKILWKPLKVHCFTPTVWELWLLFKCAVQLFKVPQQRSARAQCIIQMETVQARAADWFLT